MTESREIYNDPSTNSAPNISFAGVEMRTPRYERDNSWISVQFKLQDELKKINPVLAHLSQSIQKKGIELALRRMGQN